MCFEGFVAYVTEK